VDLLIVSGDLTHRHSAEGYEFAADFLGRLADALSLDPKRVLIVPGNHDLDRKQASLLRVTHEELGASLADKDARTLLELPLSAFKGCVDRLGAVGSLLTGAFHDIAGLPVRASLLNTCWLCRARRRTTETLSVSTEPWHRPVPDTERLSLVVMHHSPAWLMPSTVDEVQSFLLRHADLVFCGHDHNESTYRISEEGRSFWLVAGGQSEDTSEADYHRVLLSTVHPDWSFELRRLLRDPQRDGVEAWGFHSSVDHHEIQRRRPPASLDHSPSPGGATFAALREHWEQEFEFDSLAGLTDGSEKRPLRLLYRRLSLATHAPNESHHSEATLWQRLHAILQPGTLAEIATSFHVRAKALTPDTLDAVIEEQESSPSDLTLSGHPQRDRELVLEKVLATQIETAMVAARRDLESILAGGSDDLEAWTRVLGAILESSEFTLHAVNNLLTDLQDRATAGDPPSRGTSYSWLLPMLHALSADRHPEATEATLLDLIRTRAGQSEFSSIHGDEVTWLTAAHVGDFARLREILSGYFRPASYHEAAQTLRASPREPEVEKDLRRDAAIATQDQRNQPISQPSRFLQSESPSDAPLRKAQRIVDQYGKRLSQASSLAGVDATQLLTILLKDPNEVPPKSRDVLWRVLRTSLDVASSPLPPVESIWSVSTSWVASAVERSPALSVALALYWRAHPEPDEASHPVQALAKLHGESVLADPPPNLRCETPADLLRLIPEGLAVRIQKRILGHRAIEILRRQKKEDLRIEEQARPLLLEAFRKTMRDVVAGETLGFDEVRAIKGHFAILGSPGSGKTTLLRHLCLTCSEDEIPLFVPLRLWNHHSHLESCIHAACRQAGVDPGALEEVASEPPPPRLLLLLDGLDEVRELNASKRQQLDQLPDRFPHAQIILSSRSGVLQWLPSAHRFARYSLSRLSREDVRAYVRTWFGESKAFDVWKQLSNEPLLLDSLRTPFVLRMFCTLREGEEESSHWQSRTEMYRSVTDYLLDTRDRARRDEDPGLTPRFALHQKRQALASIARRMFEAGDLMVDLSQIEQILESDRALAVDQPLDLVTEVVQRSQLFLRVEGAYFDFAHWTVREYFAAVGWSLDRSWLDWTREEDAARLAYESVPRFIIGHDPSLWETVLTRLGRALKDNPLAALMKADAALEVFAQLEGDQQSGLYSDFLEEACAQPLIDLEQASAVALHMFHLAGNAGDLARGTSAFLERSAKDGGALGKDRIARLLTICSSIRHPLVVAGVCELFAIDDPTIDYGTRMCLAKLGPGIAGEAARGRIANGDFAQLRTCLLISSDWTDFFRADMHSWLRGERAPSGSKGPAEQLVRIRHLDFDLEGLVGAHDAKLVVAHEIERFLACDARSTTAESATEGIPEGLERLRSLVEWEKLKSGIVNSALEKKQGLVRLRALPDVVELVAGMKRVDISVPEPGDLAHAGSPPPALILAALADAADAMAVKLVLEAPESVAGARAKKLMIQRFEENVPSDVTSICAQIVDDLWCDANREQLREKALGPIKAKRADFVRKYFGIGQVYWESAEQVVSQIVERPRSLEWVNLQHRFGGIMSDIQTQREKRGFSASPEWNVVGEEAYLLLRESGAAE
jgi:hypothetical protein